jgi:predicted kinase
MNKVIIVIGQSASGKTTFVRRTFCKESMELREKPFKHTISQNNCLIGDYVSNKRCSGADLLSMTIQPEIIKFLKDNINNFDTIIMEGDRINQKRIFDVIAELKVPVDLYYFYCSLGDSCKRRKETDSDESEIFVKTTITKSNNMRIYAKQLGFNIIKIDTSIIKEEKQRGLF